MTYDLRSMCVLVTRPDPGGSLLCECINAANAQAIHFPTIAFAPSDQTTLAPTLAQLGDQDWLVFMSPQAVYASIPLIRATWSILPSTVQFAAVGEGTAKALHAAGYIAITPDEWNSEGLLKLPVFQSINHKKIMLIRGENGREWLTHQLIARGAKVSHFIAYRRILPTINTGPYIKLLEEHGIDVIICTSFTNVENLKILTGDHWPLLRVIPLIVISKRIKMLAQALHFQTIWVAQNASHQALLEVLSQRKDDICQKNH